MHPRAKEAVDRIGQLPGVEDKEQEVANVLALLYLGPDWRQVAFEYFAAKTNDEARIAIDALDVERLFRLVKQNGVNDFPRANKDGVEEVQDGPLIVDNLRPCYRQGRDRCVGAA